MHVAARLVGYGYDSQKIQDDLGGDAPHEGGACWFRVYFPNGYGVRNCRRLYAALVNKKSRDLNPPRESP